MGHDPCGKGQARPGQARPGQARQGLGLRNHALTMGGRVGLAAAAGLTGRLLLLWWGRNMAGTGGWQPGNSRICDILLAVCFSGPSCVTQFSQMA